MVKASVNGSIAAIANFFIMLDLLLPVISKSRRDDQLAASGGP
jgi:hypothetical protein